jgi:hypothetical protein
MSKTKQECIVTFRCGCTCHENNEDDSVNDSDNDQGTAALMKRLSVGATTGVATGATTGAATSSKKTGPTGWGKVVEATNATKRKQRENEDE